MMNELEQSIDSALEGDVASAEDVKRAFQQSPENDE